MKLSLYCVGLKAVWSSTLLFNKTLIGQRPWLQWLSVCYLRLFHNNNTCFALTPCKCPKLIILYSLNQTKRLLLIHQSILCGFYSRAVTQWKISGDSVKNLLEIHVQRAWSLYHSELTCGDLVQSELLASWLAVAFRQGSTYTVPPIRFFFFSTKEDKDELEENKVFLEDC